MVKKILVAPLLIVFFITYLFFGGFTMIDSEIIDKLLKKNKKLKVISEW